MDFKKKFGNRLIPLFSLFGIIKGIERGRNTDDDDDVNDDDDDDGTTTVEKKKKKKKKKKRKPGP